MGKLEALEDEIPQESLSLKHFVFYAETLLTHLDLRSIRKELFVDTQEALSLGEEDSLLKTLEE